MDKGRTTACMLFSLVLMVAAGLSVHPAVAADDTYPSKPVQIILPAAPGGSLDLAVRAMAEKMKDVLGQPVIVVNKVGAGALAFGAVASAKPDGYTLLGASGAPFAFHGILNKSFQYGLNDYSPVAAYARFAQVMIVNKEVPARNIGEFVAYSKKNNKLSFGTTGFADSSHLSMELFKLAAGIPDGNLQPIHYAGVAPAMTALLGNQIQMSNLPYSAVIQKQIETGGIRALAVYSAKRSKFIPEVPTLIDEGYRDLSNLVYLSFWAPAKTPAPVLKRLEEATRKTAEDKEVRGKIEQIYHEVEVLAPQDLRKYAEDQASRWGGAIRKFNLQQKQ